jgi:hypothetical protein
MNRIIFISIILVLIITPLFAQLSQTQRKEYEEGDNYFYVYPFKKKGILVIRRSENKREKTDDFLLDLLDPKFNVTRSESYSLPSYFEKHHYHSTDDTYYTIGYNEKKGELVCNSTQIPTLQTKTLSIGLPKKNSYIGF